MTLSPEARAHLTRLRAELASTKAGLCRHGVTRDRCADCLTDHRTPEREESAE